MSNPEKTVEESNQAALREVAEAFAAEGKARHKARMAILDMITAAVNQNNSSSVKALAEAYCALGGIPSERKFNPQLPLAIDGTYRGEF